MKSAQTSWDDYRFILAVADEGSVAGAARRLGVNHATVLRRIAAFETAEGLRVFDKTARGYRVSADRLALVEAMREAAQALDGVGRLIDATRPRLAGSLRITSTDSMCDMVLPEIVPGLASEMDTDIDLIAANVHVDFSRLQADIAIRLGRDLPEELVGDRVSEVVFAVYATRDAREAPFLGLSGPISRSPAGDWLTRRRGKNVRFTADSFLTLAALAQQGVGRALLPCFIGDKTAGLIRLERPDDISSVPLWVACHRDVARSSRLMRARRYLGGELIARRALFLGQN